MVTGYEGRQGGGASPGGLKLPVMILGAKEKVGGDRVENQELGPESLQHDQYDSRNKPRRNRREMGTWRLTSIQVVNGAPALVAVAPMLKGVDVGDMGLRGQTLEEGIIIILAVGAEHGKLVGGIGFTVQQEGERHKDSRLYRGSWDEQCSRESADVKGESEGFYGGLWGATRRTERCREVVGRAKRGKEDGICDEGDSRVGRE
jgi:hypothetical protein